MKWLHLFTRRKIDGCILIFKILNNSVPVYLNNYFTKKSNVHNLKTRHKDNLLLPKIKRTWYKKTFRFVGARNYDNLACN